MLQMEWAQSPACFCAATKTGRNTIDLPLREDIGLPEHPLEGFVKPTDMPRTVPPEAEDQTLVGACVEDCVLGAVKSNDRSLIR